MAETATHLVEHLFPQVPVRQWVVTFPRRLRYFLHRDPVLLGRVRRCVLRLAVRHGALTPEVAADLARWGHGGGFSLHAAVHIAWAGTPTFTCVQSPPWDPLLPAPDPGLCFDQTRN